MLLIANNFPPVCGGSSVVYANLARHGGGRLMVMAPRISYADGLPLIGWREHDRSAPYGVTRLPLLRTVIHRPHRGGRKLLRLMEDLAIRAQVALSLLRLLARRRPRAVCVGELLASSWIIRLLGHLPHVRTMVYVHGEEITTVSSSGNSDARQRRALLAADGIIVVSRFTQHAVTTLIGEQARTKITSPRNTSPSNTSPSITLIENGVDTRRFHPAPKCARLVARHRLADRFVFISVCRLLEKKGIDQALRAFALLLAQHPDSCFLIVGAGPYGDALRALARELGISGAVVFTGQVADSELVEHYRLGDAFIMPNRELPNGDTEGFGLVFLEANACGLPVIAGRDGGSVDAVAHGENGLVVDGHSVADILAAMTLLREHNAAREALRQGGLARAARSDWKHKADAFVRACLGERNQPP